MARPSVHSFWLPWLATLGLLGSACTDDLGGLVGGSATASGSAGTAVTAADDGVASGGGGGTTVAGDDGASTAAASDSTTDASADAGTTAASSDTAGDLGDTSDTGGGGEGGSDDGSTSPFCTPLANDDECVTCMKSSCCEQVEACIADGNAEEGCLCFALCQAGGGNLVECRLQCDTPLIFGGGPATDLVSCMVTSCTLMVPPVCP